MSDEAATVEYSDDAKKLGDEIAGMTLKQAKELSDYLENEHGIKAAAGGGVVVDELRLPLKVEGVALFKVVAGSRACTANRLAPSVVAACVSASRKHDRHADARPAPRLLLEESLTRERLRFEASTASIGRRLSPQPDGTGFGTPSRRA